MYYLLPLLILMKITAVQADELRTVHSPQHRVALLELYTSEGCSSCPPADRWLSGLKHGNISHRQLIPLAFHVTYWDYIGWKDRFAHKRYDLRQRNLGRSNDLRTIYTPQFVLNGRDFRQYADFSRQVLGINRQPAQVDLKLTAQAQKNSRYRVTLNADIQHDAVKDVALFIAVVENNLSSHVRDGENAGEVLHHDYVVRKLDGPHRIRHGNRQGTANWDLDIPHDWQRQHLQLVGFAQVLNSSEILQAVAMELAP